MTNMAQLSKEQLLEIVQQQAQSISMLEEKVRFLLQKTYAPKSEKTSPDQLALFEQDSEAQETEEEDEKITLTFERKRRGKRKKLDKELERKTIHYTLDEQERQCDCGGELKEIGQQTSEQYELIPAQLIVIEHVETKYACPCCQENVKTAKKPLQPLPKSNASAGLLSHITTSKYVDALPLCRQEKQLDRMGINIPRNTMSRWIIKLSDLVVPLLNLMEDAIRAGPYQQCDETPGQVLNEDGRKATSKSYYWVRRGGLAGQNVVMFHYSPTRSSKVVMELFVDYEGYVQCDGYAAYLCLEKLNITLVGCLAHCRRKFDEAFKSISKKETAQKAKAATALKYIKRLYKIESDCKELSDQERYDARQEKAVPILNEFKQWLDKQQQVTLPKSLLGKAISYAINQWPKLVRYCEAGFLEIDNNSDERCIRPLAIGRRNYLFSDSPEGAHANARFYSLIETCKLHGHEPYAYLKHIFKELPLAQALSDYEALLPWNLDVGTVKELSRQV